MGKLLKKLGKKLGLENQGGRGPRHSVMKGIVVITHTFARVVAVVALTVEDYHSQKKRWWSAFAANSMADSGPTCVF
jgi:lysophospholipid acyltransferase (LPLAT)-like uncharacterized protein